MVHLYIIKMATGTRAYSFHTKTQTHDENLVKMEQLLLLPQDTMHCIHIVSISYHRWQIRDNLKL